MRLAESNLVTAFNLHNFLSVRNTLATFALVFLGGCSVLTDRVHLKLDEDVLYKYEGMVCDKDNKCFRGVGVLPQKEKYVLDFEATNADFVQIRSCNRSRKLLDEGRNFEFIMTPNDVERKDISCVIEAQAYDFKKQLHNFYFVAMEREGFDLPHTTICDGFTDRRNGIGACQVGVGQSGKISFDKNVKVFKGDECELDFKWAVGRDFEFRPEEPGKYVCGFKESQEPFRKAFVHIIVYEQEIFPRPSQ